MRRRSRSPTPRLLGAEVVLYQRHSGRPRSDRARHRGKGRRASSCRPMTTPSSSPGKAPRAWRSARRLRPSAWCPMSVLAPCSGGGLVAGVAIGGEGSASAGARSMRPSPRALTICARSLAAGERLGNTPAQPSICDALMAEQPGRPHLPDPPQAAGRLKGRHRRCRCWRR